MLIIFDIDGTLTATNGFDMRCSAAAFEEVFGFGLPTTDWHQYRWSTDTGIIREAVERVRGSAVLSEEMERFESTFLEGLTRAHGEEPNAVNEIPGALKLIDSIASGAEHDFGIATGGMRSTALFKLRAAGFDITGRPAAFANDSVERAELVRRVLNASSATAAEAVYVGDAVWDAKAAAELGVRFVGVTHDSPEARLRNAGVTALVKNYLDRDAFFSAVDRATSPSS